MRRAVAALAGVVLLVLAGAQRALHAQADAHAERLVRIDPAARVAVRAVIDSAREARLPTEPLVDKALEGAQKGAGSDRIVAAVRGLAVELRASRDAIGSDAAPDEIAAGANALHAGVASRDIAALRDAGRSAGRSRLTLPLAVVTDLVARAVPVSTAAAVVTHLTRAGATDADLSLFQRNVRMDIDRGAEPRAAAETRARGEALHLERPL